MKARHRLILTACAAAALAAPPRSAAALDLTFGASGRDERALRPEPQLPEVGIAYRIEATLDPATRALTGTEEIRWTNRTDAPVSTLPLHLYLNAFSHSRTTWMQEVPAPRLQFKNLLDREPDPWGHTEPLSIKARGPDGDRDVAWRPIQPDDGNPLDRSLAEVTLPSPVPPGGEVVLTIAFEARLPVPIARTGGTRDYFLIGQWYPKIGVIEPTGVRHAAKPRDAARQFHGPTEFYADFADYDVTFKVPAGWLVGATGRAEGEPAPDAGAASRVGSADAGEGLVAVRYKQRAVHDFALVAGRSLTDQWARHTPKGGGPAVDVRYIVVAGTEHQIPRWRRAIEGALDVLGSRVGPYPYETLTVVLPPFWAVRTAGMEYPTFITGAPADPAWDDALIAGVHLGEATAIHEFGHQYFYGLLASNEQEEAFLDEGFNSYWESEIMRSLYGDGTSEGAFLGRPMDGIELRALGLASIADEIREPMRKMPSFLFAPDTWGSQIYSRSAVTFTTAARRFGQDKVDRVFAEYFRRFAFKHPDADDFLEIAAEAGGPELAAFCREAFERDRIPDYSVAKVATEPWDAPLGRVVTEGGAVVITRKDRAQHPELDEAGLPPEAREADGRVLVEITEGGWIRGDHREMGTVTRNLVTPERGAPQPGFHQDGYHESEVRLTGPGWDTLPVDVEIRFADGAIVRDRWDGKDAWRRYRFLRPAPLLDARVDPARQILVDVKPENNALAASPDAGFAMDWGLWLGAASAWIAGGLSLWL